MISLRHVGLIVDDIEKSLTLYDGVFGFKPQVDQIESGSFYEHLTGISSGIARTCKCYAKDGSCIELIGIYLMMQRKELKNYFHLVLIIWL